MVFSILNPFIDAAYHKNFEKGFHDSFFHRELKQINDKVHYKLHNLAGDEASYIVPEEAETLKFTNYFAYKALGHFFIK